MDRNLQRIVKELAEKHNMSEFKVKLIIDSQFKLVRDVISSEELESVQLIHLGKFQLSEKRISNYKKRKSNENED